MADYMVFNGISNQDKGFLVEKLPDEHRPRRNTEQTPVPGRPGRMIEDLGNYDQFNTNCKINCFGHAPTDVYAWLRGEGWLTTSQDPDFMRWVSFYDQITDDRFRTSAEAGCFDTLTIPLTCQPYKYQVQQESLDFTAPAVFEGKGNENAAPIIAVTGTGDISLMVNQATLLLDDISGTIYIDCDALTAYTITNGEKQFAGRLVTVIDDLWPYLEPGYNSINWTGGVSKVNVQPWWRWL